MEASSQPILTKVGDPAHEKRKHRAIVISAIVIASIIVVVVTIVVIFEFGMPENTPPKKFHDPDTKHIDTSGGDTGGHTGGGKPSKGGGSSGSSGGTTGGRSEPTHHDPVSMDINFKRVSGGTLKAPSDFGTKLPAPTAPDKYIDYAYSNVNVHFDAETLTGVCWMEVCQFDKELQHGGLDYWPISSKSINDDLVIDSPMMHHAVGPGRQLNVFCTLAVPRDHMDVDQAYVQSLGGSSALYYKPEKPHGDKTHILTPPKYDDFWNSSGGGAGRCATLARHDGKDYYFDAAIRPEFVSGTINRIGTTLMRAHVDVASKYPGVQFFLGIKRATNEIKNPRQIVASGPLVYVYYSGDTKGLGSDKTSQIIAYKVDDLSVDKTLAVSSTYQPASNRPGHFMTILGGDNKMMAFFDGTTKLQIYHSTNATLDTKVTEIDLAPYWIGPFDPDRFESLSGHGRFLVAIGREKADPSKAFAIIFTIDGETFIVSDKPQIIKFSARAGTNEHIGQVAVRELEKQYMAILVLPMSDNSLEKFVWNYAQ